MTKAKDKPKFQYMVDYSSCFYGGVLSKTRARF